MPAPDRPSRRRVLAGLAALPLALRAAHAATPGEDLDGWAPAEAPLQGTFTLSNATLLTHTGQRIDSAGIRVEAGRIVELGASVRGGEDLRGAWLVPGFTDAGCDLGLVEVELESQTRDDNESSGAVTPDARVIDAYNALSDVVPVARVCGITTALVHPQVSRLVSGQAALMQTVGRDARAAVLLAPAGLCINLGDAGQTDDVKSRMGVAMRLRALLEEAPEPPPPADEGRRHRRRKEGDDAAAEDDDELKPAERVWRDVRAGRLRVILHAERVDDILTALELVRAYKLQAVLQGCAEGYLAAHEIAGAGVPVLLGPLDVQPSSFEHPHAIYENAQRLHAAGVKLAFRSGSGHGSRMLPTQAALAVAHGLPHSAAIQALTAAAGEIFGVEGLGRLELGAPATLFQVDGDPLQPRFPVRQVWIGGRRTSMETRQTRLYERYRTLW